MDYGVATKAVIARLLSVANDNGLSEADIGPLADAVVKVLEEHGLSETEILVAFEGD